jgi:hypothetical protein
VWCGTRHGHKCHEIIEYKESKSTHCEQQQQKKKKQEEEEEEKKKKKKRKK